MSTTITWERFPVHIDTPDGAYDQAKVISDGVRAWAFRSSQGQPVLIGQIDLTEAPPVATQSFSLVGLDGTEWKLQTGPGMGCGCGNVLKRYGAAALAQLVGA